MQKLGSEIAGHDESSQRTQPKTQNPFVAQGDLLTTEKSPVQKLVDMLQSWSRFREEDQESLALISISHPSATKWCLQPI